MGIKKEKKNIIITSLMVFTLLFFEAAFILVSVFWQEIFNNPHIESGVMDFEGYNYENSYIPGFVMQGEWEFFHNKWIVTDGFEGEAVATIPLPGLWTGIEVDGSKLPRTGYASYRIKVSGLTAGQKINVITYNSTCAYRIFINGKLNSISGQLSKNAFETFSSGRVNETHPYTVSEGEILTVVVERSAAIDGGLFDPPVIKSAATFNAYDSFFDNLTYIIIGVIFSYVIFAFVLNFGLFGRQKRFSSALPLLFVFIHFVTSKEAYIKISRLLPFINYSIIRQISFLSGFLVIAAFIYHLIREKGIAVPRKGVYALAISNVCFVALYYILIGTALQILPIILSAMSLVYIFYLISRSVTNKIKHSKLNVFMLLSLSVLILAEYLDNLGWLVFTMETPVSIILMMFVVCVTAMNFINIRDNAQKALSAALLEKENEIIKHQALRAQIKPHFIFNVLSSIQTLYKHDSESGDEAITKFASHLRQNIDADNDGLIPFEKEIENIENYVELENLRRTKKVTLLLDIDFSEFEVPVLSLQPLVENAIKYAETEEQENGFIRIISKLQDDFIVIEVTDNGKGFDLSDIRQNAVGLKNCGQRFKYLLNGEMLIQSKIGHGTTVTIKIPLKTSEETS